jgi:ribose transport system substrate-binding protein
LRRSKLLIPTVGLLTALFACTNGKEPASSPVSDRRRPRFVFITNSNSPFFDAARVGLDNAAKECNVEVELIRNDGSTGGQIRRLEQVAAQREVKGVMVSVVEPNASGIVDQLKALRAKGVHVVTVDSDGPADAREAYLGTNNLEAGRALGRLAAQLLPQGGKAIAFVGIRSAQNAIERVNGFKEGAGAGIQVVDVMEDSTDVNKARRNVAAALQNHPDVKMLVGIWSYNAPAIVDEVKAAGKRPNLKLVTFDAEPNTLLALKEGTLDATAVQNPWNMAYWGVKGIESPAGGRSCGG